MLTRRTILGATMAGLGGTTRAATGRATLGEDGLYQLDWYLESFLDLAEDLGTARSGGKRLAILWGLRGCPGCKRMHEVYLADPAVEDYIKAHFEVLHLNILGAREVTDFGGTRLREKALAAAYGIEATPSIQFLPESDEGLAARPPAAREVFRMPGLPEPARFLAMFRYVAGRGYAAADFDTWLKANGAAG